MACNVDAHSYRAHENEILSCDWNKYNENVVYTASVQAMLHSFIACTCCTGFDSSDAVVLYTPCSAAHGVVLHNYMIRSLLHMFSRVFLVLRLDVVCCLPFKNVRALCQVVTGSVDRTIRGFDLRAGPGAAPLFVLEGHSYAVRITSAQPLSVYAPLFLLDTPLEHSNVLLQLVD